MPFPRKAQASAGVLVELGNGDMFLFDIGTGSVANYNSLKIPQAYADKVFISHLHTDHQGDLDMLWAQGIPFGRIKPLQVWGPSGEDESLGRRLLLMVCLWRTIGIWKAVKVKHLHLELK